MLQKFVESMLKAVQAKKIIRKGRPDFQKGKQQEELLKLVDKDL